MTHPNTDPGVTARSIGEQAAAIRVALYRAVPNMPSYPAGIVEPVLEQFRLSSTAALEAEIASLKQRLESAEHAMEMALKCTPFIRSTQSQFHGVGRLHEIAYECGDPWEILRAFLQEQEKQNG